MSETKAPLSLDPVGREFKLTRIDERGQKTEIMLSEDNVLTLAQSAELLRGRILAKYTKEGQAHPPSVVMPVAQIELNADVHYTNIHMTLVQPNGARSPCFGLPSDVAQALVQSLPGWISQLDNNEIKH
jgi:hypothetical protein